MEQLCNPLNAKKMNPEQLLGFLKTRSEKFLNNFTASNPAEKERAPIEFPIPIPDSVWVDLDHRIPDIGYIRGRRGRPFVSKRIIAAAILTMIYFQKTPNIYLGNKVISASTVRKYLKIWRRRRVFKKIRGTKLPEHVPSTPIDWRWLKRIEYFTTI